MPPKSAPRVPLRRLLLSCCAAMALMPAATAAQETARVEPGPPQADTIIKRTAQRILRIYC